MQMRPIILLLASFLASASYAQQIRCALSRGGDYYVEIGRGLDGTRKAVVLNVGNWSTTDPRLQKALSAGLGISIDGKPLQVTFEKGRVKWSSSGLPVGEDVQITMYGNEFDEFQLKEKSFVRRVTHYLSMSNLRNMATNNSYGATFRPEEDSSVEGDLATDLHNHLAGHLTPESLSRIAYKNDIPFPIKLLQENGIGYPADAVLEDKISFRALVHSAEFKSSDGWARLKAAWVIGPTIRTIKDMKYAAREPITKNKNCFRDVLWEAARTTKKSGVTDLETSFGQILDPDWFQIAVDELPKIEASTGVRMKFMSSLWRHSTEAWNTYELKRTEILMESHPGIITGVDFMGAETNSSRDFESHIRAVREVKAKFPYLQIRVHAGENSLFLENVRIAVEAGADRIGHGIYTQKDVEAFQRDPRTAKIDPKTIELLKAHHIVIELCPYSNEALNNVRAGIFMAQMRQLMAAGVDLTLNTDGVGMYSGDHRDMVRLLKSWGATPDELEYFRASEKRYLAGQRVPKASSGKVEITPEQQEEASRLKQLADEQETKLKAEQKAHLQELSNDLHEKGIVEYDPEAFKGKRILLVPGSSQEPFAGSGQEGRREEARIREFWRNALPKLDPRKFVLLTDGVQSGVAAIVQEEVSRYNAQLPKGQEEFQVLGRLPDRTNAKQVYGPKEGGITHFLTVGGDFSGKDMELLGRHGGIVIAIGGDASEGDAFVRLQNARYTVLSCDGLAGASHDHASKDLSTSFKTVPELLAQLPEEYLRPEFLPKIREDAALLGQIKGLGDVDRARLIRELRNKLQSQGVCK